MLYWNFFAVSKTIFIYFKSNNLYKYALSDTVIIRSNKKKIKKKNEGKIYRNMDQFFYIIISAVVNYNCNIL